MPSIELVLPRLVENTRQDLSLASVHVLPALTSANQHVGASNWSLEIRLLFQEALYGAQVPCEHDSSLPKLGLYTGMLVRRVEEVEGVPLYLEGLGDRQHAVTFSRKQWVFVAEGVHRFWRPPYFAPDQRAMHAGLGTPREVREGHRSKSLDGFRQMGSQCTQMRLQSELY